MAKGRIENRHKSSYTLIIDEGIDPETGIRKRWSKSVKTDDESEAQRQLDIILGEIANKTFIKSPNLTVEQYFTNWLKTPEAKRLAPKTFTSYKKCIDLRIVPWIGNTKIGDLTRSQLKNFYQRIYEEGRLAGREEDSKKGQPVSKRTVLYHHQVIRRILNHAVYEDEILPRNVADKITIPEPPDQDFDEDEDLVKVFTAEQITTLERHTIDTDYYALVALALRTGMRRGELLALTWDSVDFDKSTIFVKRSISYTPDNGCIYKSTKNKNKRIIEVTSEVLDILNLVKEKQEKAKKDAEANNAENKERDESIPQYTDNKLIFCRNNGQPIHPDTPSSWFPGFCIDCGLPRLTFHCLRHTHASHLLAENEDISYVSKRLGHSDITITYKTYFHFIPLEKRDSIKSIESKFKK
ncbi:site-specific integrase [Pelosinus baikalensis]|uniref:Site-specific integrase n=1 Tax=Pelosinus baikalensis TaxID=2892015 RepID=A0ABS8HQW5_9FIRM|nr:site-specific integrase [Pelosinus baikalensis]MCC5465577.1 site-specific integrase [Pelosinus baikalensis]